MPKKLKTGLVAAAIAIVVAIAVSYGLISQETGDEIRTQTDRTLNDEGTNDQPPATNDANAQPPASEGNQPQPPATSAPDASPTNEQSSE